MGGIFNQKETTLKLQRGPAVPVKSLCSSPSADLDDSERSGGGSGVEAL